MSHLLLSRNIFSLFNKNSVFQSRRLMSSVIPGKQHHVFLGNLPLEYSFDSVCEYLKTQKITGCTGPRLAVSPKGKFRGFAFIDFDSRHMAETAITLLKDTEAGGRLVKVDLTDSKDGASKGRRDGRLNQSCQLFVGNLPFEVTREDLTDLIQEHIGSDNHFKVKLHSDGVQSLGYCHITFSNEDDMQTISNNLHKFQVLGRVINVERAVPKIKSPEQLSEQEERRVINEEEEEENRLLEKARAQKEMDDYREPEERYRPSRERRLLRSSTARVELGIDRTLALGSGGGDNRRSLLGSGGGSNNRQLAMSGSGAVRDWRAGAHGDSNRRRENEKGLIHSKSPNFASSRSGSVPFQNNSRKGGGGPRKSSNNSNGSGSGKYYGSGRGAGQRGGGGRSANRNGGGRR